MLWEGQGGGWACWASVEHGSSGNNINTGVEKVANVLVVE